MYKKLSLIYFLITLNLFAQNKAYHPDRYLKDIYSIYEISLNPDKVEPIYGINKYGNIQYSWRKENINKLPRPKILKLDYYTSNDYAINKNLPKRPAIIMLHGGGFFMGNKTHVFKEARSYAQKGYAVFSIEYRLMAKPTLLCRNGSFNQMSVYWAMQDINAAMKALSYHKDFFGIDPTKFFLVGFSAGAIASLQMAYTKDTEVFEKFPSVNFLPYDFLGDIDNTTIDAVKNQKYKIIGVAANAGGIIKHHDYIDRSDNVPTIMLHNPCDPTVPYNEGYETFSGCPEKVYGSRYIYEKMKNWPEFSCQLYVSCTANGGIDAHAIGTDMINFNNKKVPLFFSNILKGVKNETFITNIGTTTYCSDNYQCKKTSNYPSPDEEEGDVMYRNINSTNNDSLNNSNSISIIPNPTNGKVTIKGKVKEVVIQNTIGETVFKSEKNSFNISSLPTGVYIFKIITDKGTITKKVIKK